ncbi:MAG: MBOAT family protein [Clostridia bacterium]|nr:MBOAT family protein [Clostridia bacterium]
MVFSSATFLFIFLPAVFLANLILARFKLRRVQNALLMLASVLFYAWGEPVYVLLMLLSTAVNYLLARLHTPEGAARRRRALTITSVAFNIGMLAFFKYSGFLVENFNALFGADAPVPGVALPIGISFYTFQALSYVLDVYRGVAKARRNYFDVLLYISFFPQLIAGPIVRYGDIAEQIDDREITLDKTARGLSRFCVGLAKKVLVANVLGGAADALYALDALNTPAAWMAALCYALQIYFDFSGYSDMAIGLGGVFGFRFRENFNYPYIAQSIQDFWRRWHISLSTWFREYLYIPLGGNRKGAARTGINKVIVFFFTGLWHGASWNFVVWGLFHGLFIMLESYRVIKTDSWPKALRHIYTLLVVVIGFVFFRAETLEAAAGVIAAMFSFNFAGIAGAHLSTVITPIVACAFAAGCIASAPVASRLAVRGDRGARALEIAKFAAALAVFALSVLALSTSAYNPFIYFRF